MIDDCNACFEGRLCSPEPPLSSTQLNLRAACSKSNMGDAYHTIPCHANTPKSASLRTPHNASVCAAARLAALKEHPNHSTTLGPTLDSKCSCTTGSLLSSTVACGNNGPTQPPPPPCLNPQQVEALQPHSPVGKPPHSPVSGAAVGMSGSSAASTTHTMMRWQPAAVFTMHRHVATPAALAPP